MAQLTRARDGLLAMPFATLTDSIVKPWYHDLVVPHVQEWAAELYGPGIKVVGDIRTELQRHVGAIQAGADGDVLEEHRDAIVEKLDGAIDALSE